jgi:hypothetical protein
MIEPNINKKNPQTDLKEAFSMKIEITDGKFYINGVLSNADSEDKSKHGRLLGICTDLCVFKDEKICGFVHNTRSFTDNLTHLRNTCVNIISAAFQSPNPFAEYYQAARRQDKSKDISHSSSAIKSDGSLDYEFLAALEQVIKTADSSGLAVIVSILDSSCENIFADEFSVITGIFNAADWLISKNFGNVIVNVSNISHTFYKRSVLNGEKFINLFKAVKKYTQGKLILGAGMKNFTGVSEEKLNDYITASDFIPIYSANYKIHSTKKMIENICFFKSRTNIPVIMAKGDDLNGRYGSYGKNSLAEAFENGISWCYFNLGKLGIMPVNWDFLSQIPGIIMREN